ncbi:MAG: thioredoxin reductase [Actinomycetota bacterium]|jgi:CRP-like cAMP-binding protein|nr:thioredoxin reductase [Actinomycetota bacterium]MDT5369787.1 thioredoxin reductase [Mycobacterium sp.]
MLTFVSSESEASRFPTGEALNPSAPDAGDTEAFPQLGPDQVERLIAFGVVQQLPRGTVLFECGDRRVDFFLVLDGFVEVYLSRGNAQHVMYVHGRHQFTGELNIFNARAVLVGGRMRAQAGSAARGRAGGTAARSVRVYGCSGEAKRSAAGRYSTASPARMTSTSWLIRCTIARSWAMKR